MSLRRELKQATSELHKKVEAVIRLAQMGDSHECYKRTLCQFYGFYAVIEFKLIKWFQEGTIDLNYSARRKLPWIQDDLISLGMNQKEISQLPVFSSRFCIRTVAEAMGCAYVLEGSTLGGTLVSKYISRRLGLRVDSGCRFFTGYGDETASKWREFVAVLNTMSDDTMTQTEIVLSAKRTFENLIDWFEVGLPKNHSR